MHVRYIGNPSDSDRDSYYHNVDQFMIVTGGDDNAICIAMVKILMNSDNSDDGTIKIELLETVTVKSAHASSVQGSNANLYISNNNYRELTFTIPKGIRVLTNVTFVSVSMDRLLSCWQIRHVPALSVRLLGSAFADVCDPATMDAIVAG
jgi:hypothetical protein